MTTKLDISHIKFENTVFPTKKDMALWESLSPEEQASYVESRVEAGIQSGIAEPESLDHRMARVLSNSKEHVVRT